jgi:hypothetical protein
MCAQSGLRTGLEAEVKKIVHGLRGQGKLPDARGLWPDKSGCA